MMARMTWLLILGTLSFGNWCRPLIADEAVPFFSADSNQAANERIVEALSKPLPNQGLDFIETPLIDIIKNLRDEFEIEILIDKASLEDLGISADQPISISLRNMSLQSALKHMLVELELGYIATNEVLLITTQEVVDSTQSTIVYPIGDLIEPVKLPQGASAWANYSPLIDVIVACVAPDTWRENGSHGDLRMVNGNLLVVRQTQPVHEELRNTLAALRNAKEFAGKHQPAASSPNSDFGREVRERSGAGSGGIPAESDSDGEIDDDPFAE